MISALVATAVVRKVSFSLSVVVVGLAPYRDRAQWRQVQLVSRWLSSNVDIDTSEPREKDSNNNKVE